MPKDKDRVHVCTALIASIHRPKNVARPPIADQQETIVDDAQTSQETNDDIPYLDGADTQNTFHRLSMLAEEASQLGSRTASANSLSSESSDIPITINFKNTDNDETTALDRADETKPNDEDGVSSSLVIPNQTSNKRNPENLKRLKSNSICVGASELNPLTPRRRVSSFLHLHLPEFGGFHQGPHSAGPHFHIPTFTITAPTDSSSRKFSAFHGLGTFALRRHSNTSLHRTESMVSLCFRSLSNFIKENNLAALQNFLSNKQVVIDDRDDNGTTALMVACEHGSPSMVSELLAYGADPNAEDNDGWTPLLLAAKHGRVNICIALVDHGANIEHREMGGWSPLIWASYKGHEDVVSFLLEKGADVNAQGNYNISSLVWAAGRGHSAIVDCLLAAGARPNMGDKYGTTALVWACRRGDVNSVRSLLAAGASPDQAGMYSWTALLQATQGNHIEIVQMLLEHKPNVNALDKDGCTALTIACKEGYYEIAVALINSGAYINIQDRGGDTCLIHAVKGGHRPVVEALLKKYADVDVLGKERKTAVYNAVEKGHVGILKLLLQSNPDLELSTKDGDTALLRAVRSRNAEMVQLLLDKKAKVNVADKKGDTCLHIAMRARSKAIVEILLRNPKDSQLLYRPNRANETPYNIDMNYPKTILGQIFGARRLNTNDDNESMLGYELYSSALADMLSEPSLSMPITVGLYARWGSGKSFLLNKLREEMKNFAKQWIELGWQWNWAVSWGIWHIAVAGGTITHFCGASWAVCLATILLIIVLLYSVLIGLWYASRRYEWSWPYTVMLALNNKFNSLRLVLQIVFCHPPGPQCCHTLPSQPVRFHFTDQAKSSTQEGEASVIQMIVSLSNALENQYGRLCTRLYRAFRPKPIRSTADWRWRRVCCIPNIIAFEACLLCAIVGICVLMVYIVNNLDETNGAILKAVLMGIGILLAVAIVANLHTLSRVGSSLFFSPRSHIKRSVNRQPEGFLQALRPEVTLLTDMVKCLDAFTGQQTRLVVVVDALDSCEQDRVLIVLNAIHTLCSDQHSPFIIILAIDPHIISKAVEVNSKRAFTESNIGGWDYLKNMVQLPFYLQNSALRRVKIAQQTSLKKTQFLNAEDISASLQRSVSARRLSTASEIMSSQEKLKSSNANRTSNLRKLKISESVASSMNSNLHKAGLSAGPADLNRVLLTDDYFSDVNPRSMQRLMNVLYITGRLMKAFQIEFNWYHLATWVNLTEQWPFRTSWIILHHEMYEEHIDDNTSLKNIYEKVRPNIPALKEIEPLMELDRDERKLEVFLGFHRNNLSTSDLKIFLPFTINLDPYIKKVIKDEQQHYSLNAEMMNLSYPVKPHPSRFYHGRNKQQKMTTLPPIYGGVTPSGWPNWPEPTLQSSPPLVAVPHPIQSTPPLQIQPMISQFNGDLSEIRLSRLSISGVCSLVERELPSAAKSLTSVIKNQNLTGRVLQYCDLNDLKGVLNLNFGDWELFKLLILTLRELECGMPPSGPVTQEKERPEKENKSRSTLENLKTKQSNMEKQTYGQEYQVTLEEQMICGALQTLNEEALEDVLLGEPAVAPDENDSLQLVLLAPNSGWQPTTPPASLTASPQMSRKSDPSILKSKGSFRMSFSKKHVSINENNQNYDSGNTRTNESNPVIVKIEDETAVTVSPKNMIDNENKIRYKSSADTNKNIDNTQTQTIHKTAENIVKDTEKIKILPEEHKHPTRRKSIKTHNKRPSSLLISQEDQTLKPNKEFLSNRSKSAEDCPQPVDCVKDHVKIGKNPKVDHLNSNATNDNNTLHSVELLTRLKERIFHRSNSTERSVKSIEFESDNESTPLMSSERSSPSLSIKAHRQSLKEDSISKSSPCNDTPSPVSNNSNKKDSSTSSFDESPIKHTRKSNNPTHQKKLSPDHNDYTNSDVTISVDFSASPDCSLCESHVSLGDGGNGINLDHDILSHGCDMILDNVSLETNSPVFKRKAMHSRSTQSVTHLLEPYQMNVLSRGVSDTSLRSNYLWRQDAIEDEDWNNPESAV